jgi:uncharacterized protein
MAPLLSHYQARELLAARDAGKDHARISLDLNLTKSDVVLQESGVCLPEGQVVSWAELAELKKEERKVFAVGAGRLDQVRTFSDETGWARSLCPTTGAPTVLVSGFPMHRIKGIDPWEDTRRKIFALGHFKGRVLDTATGLGYTAIQAAKTAREVVTIELDPGALDIARLNPWSAALFDNPKIKLIVGDAFEEVATMLPGSFEAIIHDPPTAQFGGHLYSEEMYRRLLMLLRPGCRMFHYCGDPTSGHGVRTTEGVVRRLSAAGFAKVERHQEAFGLVAVKR